MNEKVMCRVCGRLSLHQPISRVINNAYALLQCQQCDTILTEECRVESKEIYDELYGQHAHAESYEQHHLEFARLKRGQKPYRPYQERLLAKVERRCQGRRMIQIGGGVGIFGTIAVARGWDYTIYDVSEVALGYAEQLGLKTRLIANQQLELAKGSADVIVLWEVIEHIWKVSDYLTMIRGALGQNGLLLMSTPNYHRAAYQQSNTWGAGAAPPVHVNFFTPESLASTLRLNGFANNQILVRRLYPPAAKTAGAVIKSLKYLLHIEAPPTLYSISQ